MSVKYYLCKVYGDGSDALPQDWTPTVGPYRPSIMDVRDPTTGAQALEVRHNIRTPGGIPSQPWVVVAARGEKHRLVEGNPDIDFVGEPGLREVQLKALDTMVKNDVLAKANARGVQVADLDNAASVRTLVTRMVQGHEPTFTVDDLDFPG